MTTVYRHIRPDNGEVFYVGIGSSDRPYSRKSRNRVWHFIVNKNEGEFIVDVVAEVEDRIVAMDLEGLLIEEYGKKIDGAGPLSNIEDGFGKLSSMTISRIKSNSKQKHRMTKSGRRATSKRMIGNTNGFAKGQKAHNRIPICAIMNGEYRRFDSMSDASEWIGISIQSIKRRLISGKFYEWDNFRVKLIKSES